ncbi:MAG: YedE-related selenium metabolism membrane protein, partial [Clostridia bacterium]
MAGEGDSDAAMAVVGMVVGAAFCHNFGLASSAAGPTVNGQAAVLIGLAVLVLLSLFSKERGK